ncbi:MAG TPA: DNA polymerase/3'-5' exonuclease PolX [Kiritimatiellia bacterium]|nr:DNA polymerase/3'-5' exonuclease PolX [Kiritimatiellia bacterium]HMO98055.1 DNA polymerase/3'-5' exonuclease PolX [Kiritimatiellia bacterium]HMP97001.1 DNA polymerase/3'-5' exonuclease PolX [Kiritimatiellia bacterium]
MLNQDMADRFDELADYLEIKGDNPFKIRAYRNAARTLRDLPVELRRELTEGRDLTEIPGIGKEISAKIAEMVNTGHLSTLEKIRAEFPPSLPQLLKLPGLGPKRVKVLLDQVKIATLDDLIAAAKAGRIRELSGFGAKMEASLLDAATKRLDTTVRHLRARAAPQVAAMLERLRQVEGVQQAEVAGSFRRGKETVGDLDFLVAATDAPAVMSAFTGMEGVERVLAQGETKGSILLQNGMQADLRLVAAESYGAALHYFTGSKAHNVATRRRAQQMGLKQNEYGIFLDDAWRAGRTEEEVFAALGLPWIPPELREDAGEIEAAEAGALPELIGGDDLRGDLHNHTIWSDGAETIESMARHAASLGWEYLAITDHSKRLTVANGLDAHRLARQITEIDQLNEQAIGIKILKGSEVDILEDGSLDLPDAILKELDVVIVSIHSKFNLSRDQQTERILRALDNPHVTFLAHPTGRLLLEREPYDLDMDRMLEHIRQRGCFVELNAHPLRLDLNEVYCRRAKELGIPVVINNDAHSIPDFSHHAHGICQARRGWLEKKDVLNSLPLAKLQKKLQATRLT